MPTLIRTFISTAAAWLLGTAFCPAAAEPVDLSVITFPGSGQWPLWVAQDLGMDVRNGVRLKVLPTRNSADQMAGLIDGCYDLAITAFDNVVAYHEGVGRPDQAAAPVVAVMGLDSGLLALVAKPGIGTVEDLRGQDLAVDALTTGYAFALQETLHRAGLGDGDYRLVSVGGTNLRYEALADGRYAATLLMPPFTAMAEGRGMQRLADVSRALGHYQGTVVAVRSDWATRNPARVTGYITAYREALAWIYGPANRQAAIEIYRKHIPDASQAAAEAAYSTLIDPIGGFWRDGHLDSEGMRAVLALRTRYGPTGPKLEPVSRYVQTRYLAQAKARRAPAETR